jgi:hypothetical protein
VTAEPLLVRPHLPGRLVAVLGPVLACTLVLLAARRGGLEQGDGDPVAPLLIALATVLGAFVLSWRALAQYAVFGTEGLEVRNVAGSVRARWSDVEEVRIEQRGPLVLVDLRLRGLRRWTRIGAATRVAGPASERLRAELSDHPAVSALLVTPWP